MLEDATVEVKIKLRLEQAKASAEGLLWKAHKVVAALLAEAKPCAFHKAILTQVQAGIKECDALVADLVAAGLRGVTARMSLADSAAAVEQLEAAKVVLENLAQWSQAGGTAKMVG